MARLPRFTLPGQPQHIVIRGNNRNPIFYTDKDYRYYLKKLGEGLAKHNCALHAYVLMTNHVHLLVSPEHEQGVSKLVQMLGRYYVQYINTVYKRTGTLWEGRYKSTLVDTESYLLVCYRYIELNPVRALIVDHPSKYPWSSYKRNALGHIDPLITAHDLYNKLGECHAERQSSYRALFKCHISESQLEALRDATNKAWALGSDTFKEHIELQTTRRPAPLLKGGDRKSNKFRKINGVRLD